MKMFTPDQLNNLSKEQLLSMVLSVQQENILMSEKLAVAQAARFGRSSEKLNLEGQVSFFNEIEAAADDSVPEPTVEEVAPKRKPRPKGKRKEDIKDLPKEIVTHELSDEELKRVFGEKGWKRLPDQVYCKVEAIPATYKVVEHHIAVYGGKDGTTVVKAAHPAELLNNSLASASLVAAVMNGKYTNAMPLNRIREEFERGGVMLSNATMANWVNRSAERYLSLVYDEMHREFLSRDVIQGDETTVNVAKDGRKAGAKSYMWVYRTGEYDKRHPIILYDYQKTRAFEHPKAFLQGFSGTLVCDGYSVYHKLDRELKTIQAANCWAHCRRHFANALKAFKGPEESKSNTLAYKALKLIGAIYDADKKAAEMTPEERKDYRQQKVKPLVEAYFAWVREQMGVVPAESETGKGLTYSLNQEKYLKRFLDNGNIPLDNSACERAIRPFTVGRSNWQVIDTIHGAKASAIIYSIVETAKANNLRPYDYLKHLLEEIPKHMDEKTTDFIKAMLPWSSSIPITCRKPNKKQ